MAKKVQVSVVPKDEINIPNTVASKDGLYFQGKALEGAPEEEMLNPARILSRLDHPITLSYDGDGMIVPPRGDVKIANYNKLGAIPKGITVMPLNK